MRRIAGAGGLTRRVVLWSRAMRRCLPVLAALGLACERMPAPIAGCSVVIRMMLTSVDR